MKNIFYPLLALCVAGDIQAQNTGIGVSNPSRAKLEVWGVSGTGTTTGLFGSERGISLQRNYPAIGFNQYVDNANVGRYMASGYAAMWQYVHNDPGLSQGLSLNMYPSGADNAVLPAPNREEAQYWMLAGEPAAMVLLCSWEQSIIRISIIQPAKTLIYGVVEVSAT
jgi:hypothetical protein